MNEKVIILYNSLRKDLQVIEEIYAELGELDELRRFRHLFRHAYSKRLHADRLNLVLRRALVLKNIYKPQLETFLQFLQTLE